MTQRVRAAPPVSVRCTGGMRWRCARMLLPALSAAVAVHWVLRLVAPAWPAAAAFAVAVVVLIAAAMVAWHAGRDDPVALVWDGQVWRADGCVGRLEVMIDLGPWLLLRLRPAAPGASLRWIAVSAAEAGPAWHGLRVAAYALPGGDRGRAAPQQANR